MTVPLPQGADRRQEAGEDGGAVAARAGACRSGAAIIEATTSLLAEQGFDRLSIDGIAARAGVGKATIYRHWRSKAELVIEACACLLRPAVLDETGHLRRDLLAALEHLVAVLGDPTQARMITSLVDAAQRDDELAELHRAFTAQRRQRLRRILSSAVERGEVAGDARLDVAVDLLAGPVFYRHLISHDPLTGGFVEAVVDAVLGVLGASGEPAAEG